MQHVRIVEKPRPISPQISTADVRRSVVLVVGNRGVAVPSIETCALVAALLLGFGGGTATVLIVLGCKPWSAVLIDACIRSTVKLALRARYLKSSWRTLVGSHKQPSCLAIVSRRATVGGFRGVIRGEYGAPCGGQSPATRVKGT